MDSISTSYNQNNIDRSSNASVLPARLPSNHLLHPPPIKRDIGISLPNKQRQHRTMHDQKDVLP